MINVIILCVYLCVFVDVLFDMCLGATLVVLAIRMSAHG